MARGSLKDLPLTQRGCPPERFSRTKTSFHHTLAPPSHGGFSGKFAPPATMRPPPCPPANGPATPGCFACPGDGGSGGNSSHVRFMTLAELSELNGASRPPPGRPAHSERAKRDRTG